jgi:hypothetical protein
VDESQPLGMFHSPQRKRAAAAPSRPTTTKRANASSVRFGDVFDLTSQAPLEPPPYPAPPPVPTPSSSSSSASSSTAVAHALVPAQAPASGSSAAGRPAHYYCAMPVSIVRSMGAMASQCPHCLQSLYGTKVAVGMVPGSCASPTAANYAIWGAVAGQAHWLAVCRDWFHPTCVKRVPAHAGLTTAGLQLTGALKPEERIVIIASFSRL